jgi:phosphohistidine phosphatase SixA
MLLLRHASAGGRHPEPALDRARGLDRKGRSQAARLHEALGAYEIDCIVSSLLARCAETVAPLARGLGLEVEIRPELEPSATKRDALRLLRTLPPTALVCTHREVFETLFGGAIDCEKGGAWLVARRGRHVVPTAYLPPAAPIRRPRRRVALV